MSIVNTERLVERDVVTDLVKITYRLEAQAVATLDGRALTSEDSTELAMRQADERNDKLVRQALIERFGIDTGIERASERLADRLTAIFRTSVPTEHRDGAIALAQDALSAFLREVVEIGGTDG